MSIYFALKPLLAWPHKSTAKRKKSPFVVSLTKAYNDLRAELAHIGTKGMVYIEAGFTAADIRNDGLPRSTAQRPRMPGVVIHAPETSKGPMRFACDTYTDWEANIRSISLTLTALRAVDRYGAVRDNEQYKGFAALPPPASDTFGTVEAAVNWVATQTGLPPASLMAPGDLWTSAYRSLAKAFHPDVGGKQDDWQRLQSAAELIEKLHNG